MATAAATLDYGTHAHVDDRSFLRRYIFSTDHKIIGIQFLLMSLVGLLIGGLLAMMMRWELGFPKQPMPGGGILPETMAPGGILLPEFYNALVTMHGTFMVFFAIMPLLVGVYANYLIPLKIGAPDMAFPRINMASFWVAVPALILMVAGFFVEGGRPRRAGRRTRRSVPARNTQASVRGSSSGASAWPCWGCPRSSGRPTTSSRSSTCELPG